uniref:Chemokine interleukin-8-like domain-containing protein n=1 Tax=Astyanax mexicanus TaxID=7994 RepID=A0A8B9LF64_ASTMX
MKEKLEIKNCSSELLHPCFAATHCVDNADHSVSIVAKLKNAKEVCINPETKWLQQYLKNALEK